MSFTDEALGQFKRDISYWQTAALWSSEGEQKLIQVKVIPRVLSLIERLEAAESALTELYALSGPVTEKGMAWRKAAGRVQE